MTQRLTQHHWQAHVKAHKQSGLSRAEYCRQYNLSYYALTYWSRKLSSTGKNNRSTLVPVPILPDARQNSVQADSTALKIILPGKMSIEVGDNFSPATLTRLLATLDRR
jgi:hypothetical protein